MRTRKPTTPRYITEGRAREVANEMVSTAIREQARDLEEYLRDIHKRLVALEKKQLPRYQYKCGECGEDLVVAHLSSEVLEDCPKCESLGSLIKQLTTFRATTSKSKTRSQKVGEVTEEFIKDARRDLQQQKKDLKDKC